MEPCVYSQFFELEQRHWWFQGMYALCRDALKRHTSLNAGSQRRNILDIGCGTGLWTKSLRQYGRVFALDNSDISIELCRRQKLSGIMQAAAENLPVGDASFDIITALGIIEHIDDDRHFLKEAGRVLKPGGYGLILTSAFMFLWGAHDDVVRHKRRYRSSDLKDIVRQSGLEVVKASYVNTFLFLPIMLLRIFSRLARRNKHDYANSPDLFMPPGWINKLLYKLLRLESMIFKRADMPFGMGLLLIIHKPKE